MALTSVRRTQNRGPSSQAPAAAQLYAFLDSFQRFNLSANSQTLRACLHIENLEWIRRFFGTWDSMIGAHAKIEDFLAQEPN